MAQQTAHDLDAKPRTSDVMLNKDQDFESMFLPEAILKGLKDCGFRRPSPIQVKAVPLARCGFDLIIHAKSGTGKTLVFTLLILEYTKISVKRVQSIIVTPTREIALQIADVIRAVGAYVKGLRVGTFIGGTAVSEDQKTLVGCQVAVGCPGRLRHLREIGVLDTKAVRLIVFDEADQLMDDSFIQDIKYILSNGSRLRQILACTATLSPSLESFMEDESIDGAGIATPDSPSGATRLLLGLRHFACLLPHHPDPLARLMSKQQALLHILSTVPFDQALVFSNYYSRAESICNILNKKGWSGTWLAGKQPQEERTEAVGRLKCGSVRILVATDVAARGIDAHGVNLVINMDTPHDPRIYLHRAGRAGRYGSHGVVVSIVSHGAEEDAFRKLLGRIGGAAMRVGVITKTSRSDLWTVDDRELEQMHGIPPEDESEDSGRDSEVEGLEEEGGGGSEAEADRHALNPRRKRKKERRSTSMKSDPPSRFGSNKKVKFANDRRYGYSCDSPILTLPLSWDREERGVRDLVVGFSRMNTGGTSSGGTLQGGAGDAQDSVRGFSRNKRKFSAGGSESNDSTSSCSSSCSEGEYILSEPDRGRPSSYPPLDQEHFRSWYSLWHNHSLELKRYVEYCRSHTSLSSNPTEPFH